MIVIEVCVQLPFWTEPTKGYQIFWEFYCRQIFLSFITFGKYTWRLARKYPWPKFWDASSQLRLDITSHCLKLRRNWSRTSRVLFHPDEQTDGVLYGYTSFKTYFYTFLNYFAALKGPCFNISYIENWCNQIICTFTCNIYIYAHVYTYVYIY